jgi:SAM-dependent methyltransferase
MIREIIFKKFLRKARCLSECKDLISNKYGLEIGGPSRIFSKKGLLPIYPCIGKLDNCNFSSKTIWEGQIENGLSFNYSKNHGPGFQYILDATELKEINSGEYEFIISSHVIEHIANPIKALYEWIRVLKEEGILIVIIPHKDGTFDHKRKITDLSHLISDYNSNIKENDLSHLEEILKYHDLRRDKEAGSFENFKKRSEKNFENRSLHHHVFNTYSAIKLIDYVNLKILKVEVILPFHIIIIAKKLKGLNNQLLLNNFENLKVKSPFMSDKLK